MGGSFFLLRIPGGGGVWRGGGAEGLGGCLRRIGNFFFWGGGGLNIFFSGPKCPPSFESKLLPAVLLFLRIYYPKIIVTVTVLKFG